MCVCVCEEWRDKTKGREAILMVSEKDNGDGGGKESLDQSFTVPVFRGSTVACS